MDIRKAVITAGGWGTRFLPATKAQPKEMLPIIDKPLIQYVVEEAVESGIQQLIFVTALGKRAIEDYFDRSFELEYALDRMGAVDRLAEVRRISELADVCYIRQKEQLGLGHAVLITKELVGNEPFALFLPDDIIEAEIPCMKQMLEVYQRYRCSLVALEEVPPELVRSYGIIEPKEIDDGVYQIMDLVEKPEPGEAPSNLGITGRYILTPEIFKALERTPPGRNNEIQLTDGLRILLESQCVYGYRFRGTRYDAGTPLGLLKASVHLALHHPVMGREFRDFLKHVVAAKET